MEILNTDSCENKNQEDKFSSAQSFLAVEFKERKARNPNFSLRSYARWLNISPSQLSQMLSGKRPVTLSILKKINSKLNLSPLENQKLIQTVLKKKNIICESNTLKQKTLIQEDVFKIISDWYHLAILSLSKLSNCKSDPRWIANKLGISVEQANIAIQRLVRLNILKTKPTLKQVCEPFEAISQIPSQAIRKYHKQNLNLAIEKIETVPNQFRQFQSLSLAIDPDKIHDFKILMDDFLDQAALLAQNSQAKEIYNLNVQLFPVTKLELNKETNITSTKTEIETDKGVVHEKF